MKNYFPGAYIFIALELPSEKLEYETKLAKNVDVEDAVKYLKSMFWIYATSDRFNLTQDQYVAQVSKFFYSHTLHLLNVRP